MYNTNYKCVKPFDVWLDAIGPDGKKIPYRVERGTIWRLVWCGGAQSFKDIKKLVAENPGLGWKVRDNIIHNCVTIYSFTHDVMRIMPYEYLVEGKKNSLFIVPAESFELMYELDD